MAGNVKNMGLTSLDDLFKSEQERQQDTHERILNIPVGEIYPYARQPYSIKRPTPDLVRLMDSIEQVGVAEPLIVRPRTEGGYEIISGHRRDYCARTVGLESLPVIVREYTDDEADILVVDYTIRKTSDELCKAENLSVLSPEGKGKHYAEWKAQQEGKPTLSQMLRDEIDLVIRDCFTFPDFLNLLEKKGYTVSRNPNRKYLTVRPPGAKRNFRLDRLGEGYTVEDIKRRIQEQQRAILEGRVAAYQPLPVRRYRFSGSWKTVRKKKITGFYALYLR